MNKINVVNLFSIKKRIINKPKKKRKEVFIYHFLISFFLILFFNVIMIIFVKK
jgi:hypothetical protein